MTWRKGELSVDTIDREWPHQVALPADRLVRENYSVMHDFCRGLPQKSEPDRPQPKNVINLMDALKRSIAAEGGTAEKKPPAPSQKQREKKPVRKSGKGTRKAG